MINGRKEREGGSRGSQCLLRRFLLLFFLLLDFCCCLRNGRRFLRRCALLYVLLAAFAHRTVENRGETDRQTECEWESLCLSLFVLIDSGDSRGTLRDRETERERERERERLYVYVCVCVYEERELTEEKIIWVSRVLLFSSLSSSLLFSLYIYIVYIFLSLAYEAMASPWPFPAMRRCELSPKREEKNDHHHIPPLSHVLHVLPLFSLSSSPSLSLASRHSAGEGYLGGIAIGCTSPLTAAYITGDKGTPTFFAASLPLCLSVSVLRFFWHTSQLCIRSVLCPGSQCTCTTQPKVRTASVSPFVVCFLLCG